MSASKYSEYINRFENEGIDVAAKAFKVQQEITEEMQQKDMFGKWDNFLGALELSAYTALAAYKDGLAMALMDMIGSGEKSDEVKDDGKDDLINFS